MSTEKEIKKRKRNKLLRRLFLIDFLIIIILCLVVPWILWNMQPAKKLNVLILDKTVADNSNREHSGLIWLLNHKKYLKQDGTEYNSSKDYYGFFPLEKGPFWSKKKFYETKNLPENFGAPDLIYLADTYGVFSDEFYGSSKDLPNKLLYGGLTQDDVNKIRKNLKNKTTLIAEFNTFAYPTKTSVTRAITRILGINWSGWYGKYINELNKNSGYVPLWAIREYEKRYNTKWELEGEGFLFVNTISNNVEILTGDDLKSNKLSFEFSKEGKKEFGIKKSYGYYYWFDIVSPKFNSNVLANFNLKLSDKGQTKLKRLGIPSTFPAVIRYYPGNYTSYYLAGDFIDNQFTPRVYQFYKRARLEARVVSNIINGQNKFFWNVYVPMMEVILKRLQ